MLCQLVTQHLPLVSFPGVVIFPVLSKTTLFRKHGLHKKSIQTVSLAMIWFVLVFFPKQVTFHKIVFKKYLNVLIKVDSIAMHLEAFLQIGYKQFPRKLSLWVLFKTSCSWMISAGDNTILTYGNYIRCRKRTILISIGIFSYQGPESKQ